VEPITVAQLALAVIGIVVWGYGTRTGDPRVGWAGIILLAIASLLRFVKRRQRPPDGGA
jgi:hypothetical protein